MSAGVYEYSLGTAVCVLLGVRPTVLHYCCKSCMSSQTDVVVVFEKTEEAKIENPSAVENQKPSVEHRKN